MEIDFLGLNSPTFKIEQEISKDAFSDKNTSSCGGVETSLSLSTSTFRGNLNINEMITSSLVHYNHGNTQEQQPTSTGFLFDLNQNLSNLIPGEAASLPTINPDNVFIDNLSSEKAESAVLIAGKASLGLCNGDTPTVAMARRASLARFLEKRSHRMNKAKTSHNMGKSLKKGKTSIERSQH
ncbi:hypothetical protein ACP275_11G099300 [Erythranthe tilingii]